MNRGRVQMLEIFANEDAIDGKGAEQIVTKQGPNNIQHLKCETKIYAVCNVSQAVMHFSEFHDQL